MGSEISKRMRIAILSNYPADHATFTGGVETATAALLEGLRDYQDEFEFHIVSVSTDAGGDIVTQRNGFTFHFLAVPDNPLLRLRFPYKVVYACRKLRQIQPVLVHCQDIMALALASIWSGYRRVFTVHGVKRHEARKWRGREFWSHQMDALIERFVHRHFQSFICISPYVARLMGEGKQTFAIPNAVRSIFFRNDNPMHSTPRDKRYFLFVGALIPLKRPMDLLLAHAELRRENPDLEIIFCGAQEDPGYFAKMKRFIAERQLEGVRFLGAVNTEVVLHLLAGAVALVQPSIQENSPMSIAEAMVMGIPVVATCVGGIPYLVKHEKTGFLYEPGNLSQLMGYLVRLLECPNLRCRMGQQAAREALTRFQPEHVAESTIQVYRSLIGQPQRRR